MRQAVVLRAFVALAGCAAASLVCSPASAAPPSPAPFVPAAPPQAAIIPPPDEAPPHPVAPPPPPPVHDDAPGGISAIPNGLRLTFGTNRADLNPTTEAAMGRLAQGGIADPKIVYNLDAHAPGTAQDSSTPRRLSLARALAVRSSLINAGIASTRIYVHAMGAGQMSGAPADRVDILFGSLESVAPPVVANHPVTGTAAASSTPRHTP